IMAARIAGCEPVIAVDINNERLSAAADAGATHCINPAETDLMTEINRITQGRGVNYSVESAGHPGVMKNAVQVLAEQGSCVLTGVVAADAVLPVDI
ncbi:zinc-binding dehydrogenase, partial [Escherichia coli]